MANPPRAFWPEVLDFPDPPETRNAAPAGPRNGVAVDEEVLQLQCEYSSRALAILATFDPPESPLDRPIAVTEFADASAKVQIRTTVTLRNLAKLIEGTRAESKAALPWLKLATFGDMPTAKGTLRHNANLLSVDGIEGDYDAGTVSLDEACSRLAAAGLAALIYTTPSHTPAAPRWRVLCPLASSADPDARDDLCARVNGALGGILAPESFTASQAYYFGAIGVGEQHEVRLVDGSAVDERPDLPRIGRSPAPQPVAAADDDPDSYFPDIEPDWTRISEAIGLIPSDDRDVWLKVGMALHAESRGSEEGLAVWTDWSKASDKFDGRVQVSSWRSFHNKSKRVAIGSLFHLAEIYGWNAKPAPSPSRLTFLTPSQCEATPSRGYVIKGIIAPGDVGCIFGAPGAGKSLIAPHIGYAVAQGREAFGIRAKAGRVFYVAAEDPLGMRGRVTALKMKHGDADGFTLVEGVSELLSADSPDMDALKSAVETQRPVLVFIDTLAMAFPGLEENSADAMGRVVAVARSLAQWGAAVILIHHDTKAEGKTPRGHSLLNGALDMAVHLSRDEEGVRGKLTKNRNGSCDRDMAFSIDTRPLGFDEDGDAITAALVYEMNGIDAPRAEKLSPSAKAALQILARLEADNPDNPVSEYAWRNACVAVRDLSGSENPESRTRTFRRASKELAGKRRTIIVGNTVRTINPATNAFADLSDGFDE